MFIAQIKPPHPSSSILCLVCFSLHRVLLFGWTCLRQLMVALSQAPVEVTGRETELSNARGRYKAC